MKSIQGSKNTQSDCCPSRGPTSSNKISSFPIENVSKYLFRGLLVFSPIVCNYLRQVMAYRNSQSSLADLAAVVLGICLSFALHLISNKWLVNFVQHHIALSSNDPTEIKIQKDRVADNLRGFLTDVLAFGGMAAVTYGWAFFPAGFGGKLDLVGSLSRWPLEGTWPCRAILLAILGHYLERSAFELFTSSPSKIVNTKLFHHFLAGLLIVVSVATGYEALGAPVILTHALTGLFACLHRMLKETNFAEFRDANFLALLTVWIYSRIYVFGSEVVGGLAACLAQPNDFVRQFAMVHVVLMILLLLLLAFDLYWAVQFLKIAINKKLLWLKFIEIEPKTVRLVAKMLD